MTVLNGQAFAFGVLSVIVSLEQLNEALLICRESTHPSSSKAADLIKAELERRATAMSLAAGSR